MSVDTFNHYEVDLIEQFKLHPLFDRLDRLSWDDFLSILIQRRFLSLSIVEIYEFVIDALTDLEIKRTVRGILNEEYPRNTKGIPLPSHRELLFQDLLNLGATHEQILTAPQSSVTQRVRNDSYHLMVGCLDDEYAQIGLVVFLRLWAEILVSVEYSCLWPRISERLSDGKSDLKVRSEFYYFHQIHDRRNSDIGRESLLGGLTHAQELALHLRTPLSSKPVMHYCMGIEARVCRLKYEFYEQFIETLTWA
jgi:hypothetical protein